MAKTIDLNADLGEYDDAAAIARDTALMQYISSCNIACGGHAGTPALMRTMLDAAKSAGIAVGAHPAYPDRENFGRKSVDMPHVELCGALVAQVAALREIAAETGVRLTHIKPHGALYNDLADDADLAEAVTKALHARFPDMKLVGLADGAMRGPAAEMNADYVGEAFIDRSYTAKKRLTPRSEPGAVLDNDAARIAQALSLALDGQAQSLDGTEIAIDAQSLCIHSDSDGALETAKSVRTALENTGIRVAAV